MNGLAPFFSRYPKTIFLFFIVLTCVLAWFAQNFKIDASAETLLLKNNKLYIETQVMDKRFSPQEFILVAYEPKTDKVFSQQTFDNLAALMESFKTIDRVEGVTSILNVPLLSLMGTLKPDLKPDNWTWQNQHYSPEKMKSVFDNHPLYTDLLVNKQQTATAIQIVFKADPELTNIQNQITEIKQKVLTGELSEAEQHKVEQLKRQAEPLVEALNKTRQAEINQIYQITGQYKADANIYLGGAHVLGFQLIQIIQNDLVLFGSAIALVICLLLWVLFRQWQWVFIPILCCFISVIMTVGFFGMLDMRTTVISSNFIALQLILTLAIVIHLIVEYRQIAENNSELSAKEVAQQTFIAKVKPCFYAGLTTSVGFGSLVFSGIQPVVSFGWMMIVAMIVSIIVSLVLFPTLLCLLSPKHKTLKNGLSSRVIKQTSKLALTHKTAIFCLGVLVFAVSVIGTLKLDVENSFLNYFKESTQIRQELVYIDQEFGGSTAFDLVYTIPKSQRQNDLALTAEAMQTIQKIQHVLQQYPAVGNVTSVVNFAELAKRINNGAPLTEYELTVIYQLVDKSLTEQLLGAYYSPEHHQLRISSRIQDATEGLNRAQLLADLNKDIQGLGVTEDSYRLTNLFVLYQDILQRLFKSQILTLGIVYVVLCLVLFAIFRSFKIAIIAIIPNIISTLAILGTMGWLNIPLDLMTITIAAIAMGIAVDDTIHFVHRYLAESDSHNSDDAIKKTFNSVGYALVFTSLIITLGFSLLSFSDFVPSILFGLLTGLAMLIALLTDLTLLPAMLNKFVKAKSKST